MCTYIVEHTFVAGSGKGERGWFPLAKANVSYDHPFHAPVEHALNIDFVDSSGGLEERVAVELTLDSARDLAMAILAAADRAEAYERNAGAVAG
jgi:hypothetical protein